MLKCKSSLFAVVRHPELELAAASAEKLLAFSLFSACPRLHGKSNRYVGRPYF